MSSLGPAPDVSLVPPSLLQTLGRLGLKSRRRATGVREGGNKSRRTGRSQEFADHRPYVPGDDLRFLDWHLLGRLDTLWIKLFEEESDRTVQLLVDCSGSMEGDKLQRARELAGVLAFVALGGQDRVAVGGIGEGLSNYSPPLRGRRNTQRVFKTLETVQPGGVADLQRALQAYPRNRGGSIALLFTDFLYEEGVEGPLRRLLSRFPEVVAFHILSPVDVRPDLSGDVMLVDSETGEELPITADERTLDNYGKTVRAWADNVEATCARLGVTYSRQLTTTPLEDVVLRDLRHAGLLG